MTDAALLSCDLDEGPQLDQEHGLDWKRMKDAPGIAGSQHPEQEGAFLCEDEWEADWFVRMNNTGGPVDVWAVGTNNEAIVATAQPSAGALVWWTCRSDNRLGWAA